MKQRLLIGVALIIFISMFTFGCTDLKPWFTPHSPQVGVKEQWQIQGYHLNIDSPKKFAFDIGLAEKSTDYSFWLDKLSWHEISTSEAETLFGKTTTEKLILTNNSNRNPIIYDLVIPNTLGTAMPATKLGYGKGDPRNLVDSVISLHEGDSEHIVILANTPIQWIDTSVDLNAQTVSFTWVPIQ